MRLLLGSGGFSTPDRREAWSRELDHYLGAIQNLLFIPYALADHDGYVAKMVELGFQAGRGLTGIHRAKDPKAAVESADAIYIGGGNSFRLLDALYRHDLLGVIRDRVRAGVPYIGVSAGTNMACPTMRTTNDMPIAEPPSLTALGLIPFQINPHYFSGPIFIKTEAGMIQYGGETRDDRLHQFHEENDTPVLGLWEGAILRLERGKGTLAGTAGARWFGRGLPEADFAPGADLSLLLQ